ncbi:MAG: hypothetical protein IJ240_07485 [Clostridia bacterium]|nr:hypothetical protein [Clostridia bacterium]
MIDSRFLQYSLRHNRPIRVLIGGETMKYMNVTVIAIGETEFAYLRAGRKRPETMPFSDLLAVSYARGDDGDTLKNEQRERP